MSLSLVQLLDHGVRRGSGIVSTASTASFGCIVSWGSPKQKRDDGHACEGGVF
jgi:hypothetical protein